MLHLADALLCVWNMSHSWILRVKNERACPLSSTTHLSKRGILLKGAVMKSRNLLTVVALVIVLGYVGLSNRTILSQSTKGISTTKKGVSPHTVIYLAKRYRNGVEESQRIVSRSVNESGEWYEETLTANATGKGIAVGEDGHHFIDEKSGDKTQYKSASPRADCTDLVDKIKGNAKDTVEIVGLTAYVIGGEEVGGMSYERAYARETGCTPLRVRVKSKDGYEITYDALKVIFSINSTLGKDLPVTKDIRKE